MLRLLVLCHCTPPPSLSSVLHLEVDMASKNPSDNTFLFFLFFFFSMVFICALCRPGFAGQVAHTNSLPPKHGSRSPEMATTEGSWRWRDRSTRRLMIGSTAPTCTYNECKGCRLKCRAEQVPVDAGDPMNSAYRYRCVCHG